MSDNGTLTAVPGVEVGHWTNPDAATGVTVISFPEPNVASAEIRGAAPGTRDVALLEPDKRIETIQALVFAGGSAFGLAAADGVVSALEKAGRGHETIAGRVPIVPTAIIFDLMLGDGTIRPTASDGAAAFAAVSADPVEMGSVGAGTGATVSMWRGLEHIRKGGIGSAAATVGDAVVGALSVVNASGDVFDLDGTPLTGGPHIAGPPQVPAPTDNTTLVAVATNATLSRMDLLRLNVRGHDALGSTLRPAHTRYDGDVVFSVSCGGVDADHDHLGEAVFGVVARSVVEAVQHATGLAGISALSEVGL